MGKNSMKEKFDRDYFVFPTPGLLFSFLILVLYCLAVVYNPDVIPAYLGFVRTSDFYVAEHYRWIPLYFLWFTAFFHVFVEATYAWKLCRDAGMSSSATTKWVISTALFGGISVFNRLKPYLKRFNSKRD